MVDIVSLSIGFLFGLTLSIVTILFQHRKSMEILKIQLFLDAEKKAYLKLWEINKNHEGIELANEIENFLKSPHKLYLGDTEPKLREKVAFIREKYEKVYSLEMEKRGKIWEAKGFDETYEKHTEENAIEDQKEEQRRLERMDPVEHVEYEYEPKIRSVKTKFYMETKDINSDIFDLIEKKMKKPK